MLALIFAVAVVATVGGSMAFAQTSPGTGTAPAPIQGTVNLPQMILSSVKTGFTDAADTAAGQVTNGQVLAGGLVVQNGYAVYAFKVTDGKSVYAVIIDAGNGQVLKVSQAQPLNMGAFLGMGGRGMGMHGHMGMKSWSHQQPSGSTSPGSPSGTTQSGFQE